MKNTPAALVVTLTLSSMSLIGCAGDDTQTTQATSTSSGSDPVQAETADEPVATLDPAPEVPAIVEEAPPPPAPTPEGVVLVQRILATEDGLASAIDPARGLLLVRYEEAGPGEGRRTRETKTQQHVCASTLARRTAEVRRLLTAATEQSPVEDWTCSETECVAAGMEWTPTIHMGFARDASGALVLDAVLSVSEAALGEEWLTAAATFIERARAAAAARPCPAPRPAR